MQYFGIIDGAYGSIEVIKAGYDKNVRRRDTGEITGGLRLISAENSGTAVYDCTSVDEQKANLIIKEAKKNGYGDLEYSRVFYSGIKEFSNQVKYNTPTRPIATAAERCPKCGHELTSTGICENPCCGE